MGKVQLKTVVADADNRVRGVGADTYKQAAERIRRR